MHLGNSFNLEKNIFYLDTQLNKGIDDLSIETDYSELDEIDESLIQMQKKPDIPNASYSIL